jgi:hypothetical protein
MDHQDIGLRGDQHDRREILQRIEAGPRVQAHVDREYAVVAEEQRVTVGHAARNDLRRDVSARARPVVYHHRLPEAFREPRAQEPRHGVARPAGGKPRTNRIGRRIGGAAAETDAAPRETSCACAVWTTSAAASSNATLFLSPNHWPWVLDRPACRESVATMFRRCLKLSN